MNQKTINGIYTVTKHNTTGYNVDISMDGYKVIMQLDLHGEAVSIIPDTTVTTS